MESFIDYLISSKYKETLEELQYLKSHNQIININQESLLIQLIYRSIDKIKEKEDIIILFKCSLIIGQLSANSISVIYLINKLLSYKLLIDKEAQEYFESLNKVQQIQLKENKFNLSNNSLEEITKIHLKNKEIFEKQIKITSKLNLNYFQTLQDYSNFEYQYNKETSIKEALDNFNINNAFGFNGIRENVKLKESNIWNNFNMLIDKIPDIMASLDQSVNQVSDFNFKLYYIFKKILTLIDTKEGDMILLKPYFLKLILNSEVFRSYYTEKIHLKDNKLFTSDPSAIPFLTTDTLDALMTKFKKKSINKQSKYSPDKILEITKDFFRQKCSETPFLYNIDYYEQESINLREFFIDIRLNFLTLDKLKCLYADFRSVMNKDKNIVNLREKTNKLNITELTLIYKLKEENYFLNISFNSLICYRRIVFDEYVLNSKVDMSVYNLIRTLFIKRGILLTLKDEFEKNENRLSMVCEQDLMILFLYFIRNIPKLSFSLSNLYSSIVFQTKYDIEVNLILGKQVLYRSCEQGDMTKALNTSELFINFIFFLNKLINQVEEKEKECYIDINTSNNIIENKDSTTFKLFLIDFILQKKKLAEINEIEFKEIEQSKKENNILDLEAKNFFIKKETLALIKNKLMFIIHYLLKGESTGIFKLFDITKK